MHVTNPVRGIVSYSSLKDGIKWCMFGVPSSGEEDILLPQSTLGTT